MKRTEDRADRKVGRKSELLECASERAPWNGVFIFSDELFQNSRPSLPRVPRNLCASFTR